MMRSGEDPHWHERGAVPAGAIWVAGLYVFVITVVFVVVTPTLDRLAGDARRTGQPVPAGAAATPAAPAAKVILETFRDFPPPPNANPECVAAVLRTYYPTLRHNGHSWVDSADPAPPVNSFGAAEWRGRMSVKVGGAWAQFRERGCDKEPARGPAAPPPPQEDPRFRELLGTYQLRATGQTNPECASIFPIQMDVTGFQSSTEINLRLTPSGEKVYGGDFPATPIRGYNLRLEAPYFSMSGSFIGRSTEIIVEGTFSTNVGGGCRIDFEGTKARSSP
jgi:hypothetical protein